MSENEIKELHIAFNFKFNNLRKEKDDHIAILHSLNRRATIDMKNKNWQIAILTAALHQRDRIILNIDNCKECYGAGQYWILDGKNIGSAYEDHEDTGANITWCQCRIDAREVMK